MFSRGDRSFALAVDFGPCSFGEDGPWKPTEVERQVVKSSQVMGDAISVRMNNGKQIFTGRLHERFLANWIISFAAKSPSASLLCCRNPVRSHFVHYGLPGSLCHFGVVCGEVGASEI